MQWSVEHLDKTRYSNNFFNHRGGAKDQSMSAVVAAAVGVGVIAYLSMEDPDKEETDKKSKKRSPDDSLNTSSQHGNAVYSDVRNDREIMDSGVHFVSEERGHDLSGVECRWLKQTSGAITKTYDMQTQFVQVV